MSASLRLLQLLPSVQCLLSAKFLQCVLMTPEASRDDADGMSGRSCAQGRKLTQTRCRTYMRRVLWSSTLGGWGDAGGGLLAARSGWSLALLCASFHGLCVCVRVVRIGEGGHGQNKARNEETAQPCMCVGVSMVPCVRWTGRR